MGGRTAGLSGAYNARSTSSRKPRKLSTKRHLIPEEYESFCACVAVVGLEHAPLSVPLCNA